MKISEGIRKGSQGKVQIRGQYWTHDKKGVCAIGALMLVVEDKDIILIWPELKSRLANEKTLMDEMMNRNDNGSTFNEIIEWLESIGY
jgi:hypothetical protein